MINQLLEKTVNTDKNAKATIIGPDGTTFEAKGDLVICSMLDMTDAKANGMHADVSKLAATVFVGNLPKGMFVFHCLHTACTLVHEAAKNDSTELLKAFETISPDDGLIMSVLFSSETNEFKQNAITAIIAAEAAAATGSMDAVTAATKRVAEALHMNMPEL